MLVWQTLIQPHQGIEHRLLNCVLFKDEEKFLISIEKKNLV